MARPKYNSGESTAREKLEVVFWKQLEEKGYNRITVASLVGEAGLNRNTFYYYYDSVDDMARKAFEETLAPAIPLFVEQVFRLDLVAQDVRLPSDFAERFNRLRLFLRSDSPLLINMVKDTLRTIWLGLFGVTYDELSIREMFLLEYMIGGALSMAACDIDDLSPQMLVDALYDSPLRRGVSETLTQIGKQHGLRATVG